MKEETIFTRLENEFTSGKEILKSTKTSIENYIINPLSNSIKGFTSNIIKLPNMLMTKFSGVFSNINSNISSILGTEIIDMFGMASNLIKGSFSIISGVSKSMFNFGKKLFGGGEEKEQTNILKSIFSLFKKKNKQEQMQYKGKEKGDILSTLLYGAGITLGVIVGGFVATIGGIFKSALIPFQIIKKVISILSSKITFIDKFLKSSKLFKGITNIVTKVKSLIISPFNKLFSIFGKFSGVMSKIPLISKFFAGFSKGLGLMLKGIPVIGWAITIINGIIDFFKGFTSTQGSFLDKLKGGLFATIKGLFDPIIWFIDWIGEKILGFFGINMEGTISQIFVKKFNWVKDFFISWFNMIKNIFNTIIGFYINIFTWFKDMFLSQLENIKNIFSTVLHYILAPFNWIKNTIQNFIGLLKSGFENVSNINFIENIVNILLKLKDAIKEWILENIPGAKQIAKGVGSVKKWITGWFKDEPNELDNIKTSGSTSVNSITGINKERASEQLKKEQNQQEKIDKLIKQNNTNNNVNNNATIIQQTSTSNEKSQLNESPDEVENFGIIFMNNSTLGGAI